MERCRQQNCNNNMYEGDNANMRFNRNPMFTNRMATRNAGMCGCMNMENRQENSCGSCGTREDCNDKKSCPCMQQKMGCQSKGNNMTDGICCGHEVSPVDSMKIAMGYVPWQTFKETMDACKALQNGTVFPELVLPFHCENCRNERRCR